MNLTINNSPISYTGKYEYVVKCRDNKKVPYLFNQVKDLISGRGIPASFQMGPEDQVILNPETKLMAHSLKKDLKRAGIKLAKKDVKQSEKAAKEFIA
ncbi:MAG: hypothetical protein K6E29_03470 [Cyanobacteria bacterium RUI128]|nr:hypothetical protein [Cyanobacteria bacterium RUI128]